MTYLRILSPSLVPLPHAKSLFLSSFTRHTHGSPSPTAAAPPPAARALDKLRGCVRRGTQRTTPLISIHHGPRRRKSSSIHAFAFLFFFGAILGAAPPLRHIHVASSHPSSSFCQFIIIQYLYHHPPHNHSPSPTITTIISYSLSPIFIQPHSLIITHQHSPVTHCPAIPAPSTLPIPHYHPPSPITGSYLRPITRPVTRLRHPPSAPHQCLLTKVTHVDCLK